MNNSPESEQLLVVVITVLQVDNSIDISAPAYYTDIKWN